MRKSVIYFTVLITLAIFGCESAPSSTTATTTTEGKSIDSTSPITTPTTPTCEPPGKLLEGNQIWFPLSKTFIAIIADSTTHSEEFGEVHRVLLLLDSNCNITFRTVLPEQQSPDYGYFLAPINYNNSSQLVGIKGFDAIYVFDLDQKKLYPRLTPSFLSERLGADAQSGQIIRLEVWEHFLIGYAQDYGTFVFDLQDKSHPKAVLPIAEYEKTESNFSSLFALPSKDKMTQLIMPAFDFDKDEFEINPMLKEPINLNVNVAKNVRNNKLIILRENGDSETPLAINLAKRKIIALPEAIQQKKTSEILKWIKDQN